MSCAQRIVAARYLRTLSTIETLLHLGQDDEARRLAAGIDHLEARELANALDAENAERALPFGNSPVIALFDNARHSVRA